MTPIEALNKYAKRGVIPTDYAKILELVAGESDRGTVILLGSLVEDEIAQRILSKCRDLSDAEKNTLTKHGGPLGSFEHRIKMGHALGIVPEAEVPTLHALKTMRNACAHCREAISFATPELRDVMVLMFEGEVAETVRKADPEMLKPMFVFGITWLIGLLSDGTQKTGRERVQAMSKVMVRNVLASSRGIQTERRN